MFRLLKQNISGGKNKPYSKRFEQKKVFMKGYTQNHRSFRKRSIKSVESFRLN